MNTPPTDGSIVRRTKGQDRTSTWRVARTFMADPASRFGKTSTRTWADSDYSGWVSDLILAHRSSGGWVGDNTISSSSHIEELELVWEQPTSVVVAVSEPDTKRPVPDFDFDERDPDIRGQVLGYMAVFPPVDLDTSDRRLRDLVEEIGEKLQELAIARKTIVSNQRSDPHINQKAKVLATIRFRVYDLKLTLATAKYGSNDDAVGILARKRRHEYNKSTRKGETHHLV